MIKKMLILLLALILSVTLFGCDDTGKGDAGDISASDNTLQSNNMIREDFASAPFFSIEEGTNLSYENITNIIEKIRHPEMRSSWYIWWALNPMTEGDHTYTAEGLVNRTRAWTNAVTSKEC